MHQRYLAHSDGNKFLFEISPDANSVYFVEVTGLPDFLEFISRYFAPLLAMIEKGEGNKG